MSDRSLLLQNQHFLAAHQKLQQALGPVRVILQKPEIFEIKQTKESNPFEQNRSKSLIALRKNALQQFDEYVSCLERHHVVIERLPIETGLYDAVYTTDTSHHCLYLKQKAQSVDAEPVVIYANMKKKNRQNEVLLKKKFYEKKTNKKEFSILTGYLEFGDTRFYQKIKGRSTEGWHCQTILLAGSCVNDQNIKRSEIIAHQELAYYLEIPVLSLQLYAPFFHLDTALMTLPCGHIILHKEAFYPSSLKSLIDLAGEDKLIFIDQKQAFNFVANSLVLGRVVFTPGVTNELNLRLQALGYQVETLNISAYRQGGGGLNCITDIMNQLLFDDFYLALDLNHSSLHYVN